jgi:hypothetical protein
MTTRGSACKSCGACTPATAEPTLCYIHQFLQSLLCAMYINFWTRYALLPQEAICNDMTPLQHSTPLHHIHAKYADTSPYDWHMACTRYPFDIVNGETEQPKGKGNLTVQEHKSSCTTDPKQ